LLNTTGHILMLIINEAMQKYGKTTF